MEPSPNMSEVSRDEAIADARVKIREEMRVLFDGDAFLVINLRQNDLYSNAPEDADIVIDTYGDPEEVLKYLQGEPYEVCEQRPSVYEGASLIYLKLV